MVQGPTKRTGGLVGWLFGGYTPIAASPGLPPRQASPPAAPPSPPPAAARTYPDVEQVHSSSPPPPAADIANKAGLLATLGNSFIAFVGAGILDLPFAFSKAGLWLSTFLLAGVALICLHCMYLIVDCKECLERRGVTVKQYGDIGYHAYGVYGQRIVDFSLVVTQVGFCIAYIIFISSNLMAVMPDAPGYRAFVWLVVPGQLLLSTLRHLKFLGWFSILADCTNLFGLSSIFLYDFGEMASVERADPEPRLSADWGRAVFFFGIAIYCYEGIGMVVPIQSSMRNPDQFKLVWGFNMFLVTFLFWSFGFVGYLAFGGTVHESITLDLPSTDYLTAFVRIALCVGLYFTFPVMMFPVYQIAETKFFPAAWNELPPSQLMLRQNLFRASVVVFAAFVASAVPSFSLFISLIGSSCCALLAFILPAMFSLQIQGVSPMVLLREAAVIAIGVIGAVVGTAESLGKIAEHFSSEVP
eukprot:TRINITY_DN60864_c0_g1_i1.p1 TRINITY_DN60864_c0_g1~~TRINITY_DN60864_c0_g1_i1.p1  ORF type:complete len:471 (+),score=137.86 TRINITY_DN60864_c0_g1_i1:107-1519(+)